MQVRGPGGEGPVPGAVQQGEEDHGQDLLSPLLADVGPGQLRVQVQAGGDQRKSTQENDLN